MDALEHRVRRSRSRQANHRKGINVKSTVLATAVAAVLTLSAADASAQTKGAATKAEVQSIQSQMQALAERLNRLETANAELKTQNSELQALADRREAEMDYLKSQTKELREEGAVASNEIAKVKGADWATKIKGRGDFRFRNENIWTERVVERRRRGDAADRERMRIRARLGFDFKATDNVKGTLLFATGGDDPRSSNQTLGGTGTRKTIGLDMAYVDWKFMEGGNLLLGKIRSTRSSAPARACSTTATSIRKAARSSSTAACSSAPRTAGGSPSSTTPTRSGENSDANIFGLQAGMKFPLLGGETRRSRRTTTSAAPARTTRRCTRTMPTATRRIASAPARPTCCSYGYDIVELGAQMGVTVANLPLTFWANYAQNMADDVEYDTAYAVGAMVGKASNAKTWEAGAVLPVDRQGRAVRRSGSTPTSATATRTRRAGCSRPAMRR